MCERVSTVKSNSRVNVFYKHEGTDMDYMRLCIRTQYACTSNGKIMVGKDYWGGTENILFNPRKLSMPISGACYCPFDRLIGWLEGVIEAKDCVSVEWEAEGDNARLTYVNNQLVVEYCDGRQKPRYVRGEIGIDRDSLVRKFYQGFRRFVESSLYEPIRYEEALPLKEAIVMTLNNGMTVEELRGAVLGLDADMAEFMIRAFDFRFWIDESCPIWNVPAVEDVMVRLGTLLGIPRIEHEFLCIEYEDQPLRRSYIPKLWNHYSIKKRSEVLQEVLDWYATGRYGNKLRELRSPIVESWQLTNPAL